MEQSEDDNNQQSSKNTTIDNLRLGSGKTPRRNSHLTRAIGLTPKKTGRTRRGQGRMERTRDR